MSILVTGSTGFVGHAICQILNEAGLDIIRVGGPRYQAGQTTTGNQKNQKNQWADISIDLSEADSVAALCRYEDVSVIIHCAGLAHQFGETSRDSFERVNVKGTESIAAQAVKMKVDRLILISTVAVYGAGLKFDVPPAGEYQESAVCQPAGPYGESKLAGEQRATAICLANNIPLTILRPSTVLGENDPGNFMRLVKAVDRRRFLWLGNGANNKSFVYKDDLGRACLEIIGKSGQEVEIYNVTAETVSVAKIMRLLENILQKRIPRIPVHSRIIGTICRAVQTVDQKADGRNKQRTLARGWLQNYARSLEKWFAEEVYSGVKLKKIYNFAPQISIVEAIGRECREYLKSKC